MQVELVDDNGRTIERRDLDALIFDLDGVITQTAALHARAWKKTFDEALKRWTEISGSPQNPFDIDTDYREFVDGRRRTDGVRTFLASRGISLPERSPEDTTQAARQPPPWTDTIEGIGRHKNDLFLHLLESEGIDVFDDTIERLKEAHARGLKTAVVSASRNCKKILEATHLTPYFDARVDGVIAAERGLKGKPAPDTFLAAALELGLRPDRAAIFEDALSGVEAGHRGGFGWVLGVSRRGPKKNPDRNLDQEFLSHGADQVLHSFKQLHLL